MPGAAYQRQVWDWDSFLTDVGISQVAVNNGTLAEFYEYQKGCVQNFADFCDPKTGRIPVVNGGSLYQGVRGVKSRY